VPKNKLPTIAPITLGGYTLDLNAYLAREYEDVSQAANELPSIAEWVNEQLQAFIETLQKRRNELDEAEAMAYFDLRKGRFADDYGGRETEDALKHAVVIDPQVRKLNEEIAVLSGWVSRLRGTQENLQMKLELVRSTEATRRKVFESSEK
jgi:hypothetical protein